MIRPSTFGSSSKTSAARACARSLLMLTLVLPVALLAQQRDTRRRRPHLLGTGEISGVVVAAETTPSPCVAWW